MNEPVAPLTDRVLAALKRAPGLKAAELAAALGVERREINHCLAYELAGRVQQAADYRWRLVEPGRPAGQARSEPAASEIARLCRYYLECIGHDMDEGVSVFAKGFNGKPDYAELAALPMTASGFDWCNEPGVSRILGAVRQEPAKRVAWLGYPVHLRRHRTARWEGFFVEPVLLWRIAVGEADDGEPSLLHEAPLPNAKFMRSVAIGNAFQLAAEIARLTEDLGLNVPVGELPEVDELVERLARVRPDWGWREALDAHACSYRSGLADLPQAGIYNRVIVVQGERSPFTLGLESELKALSGKSDDELRGTALGRWLHGAADEAPATEDPEPLLEVLPMNLEQRAAVRAALSCPHTVVTGPPGTGKSQMVTNLLVNAAWRGMKVLFASKNNKAVDVVESRVNGLGNRPVLLRLGAREYQTKLGDYLARLLAGTPGVDEQTAYDEDLDRHRRLIERLGELDRVQQQTLEARNTVDRLDAEAEEARRLISDLQCDLDEQLVQRAGEALSQFQRSVEAADPAHQGPLGRLLWGLKEQGRRRDLGHTVAEVARWAAKLGVVLPHGGDDTALAPFQQATAQWKHRLAAAQALLSYREALAVLQRSPSFEGIARQRGELTGQLARNSERLWRSWVQLAPQRLTPAQRKDVADYVAVLQLMTGQDANKLHASIRDKANRLQTKVTEHFTCWAVTSLSARNRVPYEPGYFDLVVIDEASQCDIASALPLLYRAKRSVIIGDPQQLRHISALSRPRDSELQHRYGLVENRVGWMYSVSSLYDVAAGVATHTGIVNLRDHHRSHADIIEFSNRAFYEGRLRVATRHPQLKRPRQQDPGIVWTNVRGTVTRPSAGGAQNIDEARAVVAALEDLLITRGYTGTVGVVTPFRAQAEVMRQLLEANDTLATARERSELLVDTVHSFQGDERDVMFFSPVVSIGTPPSALSFLRDNGNLFNVAITRARGLLHVVGDREAALTSEVDYLVDFANYVAELAAGKSKPRMLDPSSLGPEYPTVAKPEQVSEWERVLYRALYAAGVSAVPQYRVEQYDLDFAVIVGVRRLNIEVDGERYHRSWTGELCQRDQLRNQRLIELGWEVKRFWVYEVRDQISDCVEMVVRWVEEARVNGE